MSVTDRLIAKLWEDYLAAASEYEGRPAGESPGEIAERWRADRLTQPERDALDRALGKEPEPAPPATPSEFLARLTGHTEATVRLVLNAHVYIERPSDGETFGRAVPVQMFGSTTIDFDTIRANPDALVDLMEQHAYGLLRDIVQDPKIITDFICGHQDEDGRHGSGVAEIIAGALPLIAPERN